LDVVSPRPGWIESELGMRANHSPLQFFGLIAIACALAYGVCANVALARTMASTTEPNGAGTNSVSEAGPRSLVDATPTNADTDRTSPGLRSVIITSTPGRLSSPTSGLPEGGSANSGRQLGQVTATTAPATAAPPAPARRSTRVDVGVTPLVGGRDSAVASTSGAAPSATTTNTAPPVGTPVATQVFGRQAPSPQPEATPVLASPPPATSAAGTEAPITRPPATPPVATPPSATSPVATQSVATEPVATQPLNASSPPASRGDRGRRLIQLRTSVARWLGAEQDEPVRLITPTNAQRSPAPSHRSPRLATRRLGPAIGSHDVLAGGADLERGPASAAAHPPRSEESPKPAPIARTRAATPIPRVLPSVPPVQTRPPLGGAAAASGGAVGSVAPSVVAELAALALVLATILLVRHSLDRPAWRSALLVSRLEHPG
jgi:hypothetical protein